MRSFILSLAVLLSFAGMAAAQVPFEVASVDGASTWIAPLVEDSGAVRAPLPALDSPIALPRMAPDLALRTYENRVAQQNSQLAAYSADTLIRAQLPDTSQSGEFELQRHYIAPRTLQFKPVHFSGDGFVKTNVIARLLQSEVDHLQKDDLSMTALNPSNYKFSYKGTNDIDGRTVHVFQVKPRKKRAGLFKGRIFLDAYTGSMVRAEGSVVKSPSFFVRKVEFVQDYADVNGFTLPTHVHSEALARIVGRTVVDIYQRDYQPVASPVQASQQTPTL
jgi:hypothetical protein